MSYINLYICVVNLNLKLQIGNILIHKKRVFFFFIYPTLDAAELFSPECGWLFYFYIWQEIFAFYEIKKYK